MDNLVVVDALPDGGIVDIEVLYSMRQWNVLSRFQAPRANELADIALAGKWLTTEWAELPVVAETNEAKDGVFVRFTEIPASCTWVELSTNCLGAVTTDRLLGFFASLSTVGGGW